MANINLKASPELMALLGADGDDLEAVKALNAMAPEKVLMKWLNYQVQRVAPGSKEVTNFGAALKDCTVYANLLTAVAPADEQATIANLSKMVALAFVLSLCSIAATSAIPNSTELLSAPQMDAPINDTYCQTNLRCNCPHRAWGRIWQSSILLQTRTSQRVTRPRTTQKESRRLFPRSFEAAGV